MIPTSSSRTPPRARRRWPRRSRRRGSSPLSIPYRVRCYLASSRLGARPRSLASSIAGTTRAARKLPHSSFRTLGSILSMPGPYGSRATRSRSRCSSPNSRTRATKVRSSRTGSCGSGARDRPPLLTPRRLHPHRAGVRDQLPEMLVLVAGHPERRLRQCAVPGRVAARELGSIHRLHLRNVVGPPLGELFEHLGLLCEILLELGQGLLRRPEVGGRLGAHGLRAVIEPFRRYVHQHLGHRAYPLGGTPGVLVRRDSVGQRHDLGVYGVHVGEIAIPQ